MNWGSDLLNKKMESIARGFVLDELRECGCNVEAAARKFCVTRDEILSVLKQPKTEAILARV